MTFTSDSLGADARFRFPSELEARFEVRDLLGAGGMGAVYAAWDRELERDVAIKVTAPFGDEKHKERFRREASVLAKLDHPAVIRVYQFGTTVLCPYIVMELLDGRDLDEEIGKLTSMEPMLRVAEGLQAVHDAGLTHRDVKPSNVLRTSEGRVVLLDFGIVYDPSDTRLTGLGTPIGTPGFVPPETYRGAEPSPAADWFAYGATLYLLCEGRLPFTPEEIVESVGRRELPLVRFQRIKPNRAPATLIRACLSYRPEDRPKSLSQVLAGLEPKKKVKDLRQMVKAATRTVDMPAHSYSAGPRGRDTYPGFTAPPPPRRLARLFRILLVGVLGGLFAAALILSLRGR